MSLTFSFSDTSSTLTANFFPPITLNGDYEMALLFFDAYHSIPNIDESNNKFYYQIDVYDENNNYKKDSVYTLPTGCYEIKDIENYINNELNRIQEKKGKKNKNFFNLRVNPQTMECEMSCSFGVNFVVDENGKYKQPDNIGSILGFRYKSITPPETLITTKHPLIITEKNVLRVQCNIISGAYFNGQESHCLYEHPIDVDPGYKLWFVPTVPIYHRVTVQVIDQINIRLIDQNSNLLNFRGEKIQVTLHLRKCR